MNDPLYEAIPASSERRATRSRSSRGCRTLSATRTSAMRSLEGTPTRPAVNAHEIRGVAGRVADAARRARSWRPHRRPAAAPAPALAIDDELLEEPRNLDVRLLHYRRDLSKALRSSGPLPRRTDGSCGSPPRGRSCRRGLVLRSKQWQRWTTRGFLFPGRDSGLSGTLISCGFGVAGRSSTRRCGRRRLRQGVWAADFLADLYRTRRVTPRELPEWHCDQISSAFARGTRRWSAIGPAAIACLQNPTTCRVADRVGLALLPEGPARCARRTPLSLVALPGARETSKAGWRCCDSSLSFESPGGRSATWRDSVPHDRAAANSRRGKRGPRRRRALGAADRHRRHDDRAAPVCGVPAVRRGHLAGGAADYAGGDVTCSTPSTAPPR